MLFTYKKINLINIISSQYSVCFPNTVFIKKKIDWQGHLPEYE